MRYEGNIFRPPSEAYSLIVQVTIGCSHNKCTFCSMYKDKTFRVRNPEEVLEDLDMARQRYRRVRTNFSRRRRCSCAEQCQAAAHSEPHPEAVSGM